ncbi:hypothetical protein AZI85_17000 [Bdellovibrio bacteriovorus]|uniref:Porin domain-containing protein n=1 Tax=Bdellovibrio bacteriovorus TaxID=959 RepID=A0A150WTI8_BDEBC|nr:hypothetical protein [Bdellovibrio bacteriovorus]KYG67692.1 hypothetical protein AZI85_17000 [Bdellovibrio bacteriovorus]
MKKLLVMAAVTVAATNAFAGIKLVVRSDYNNTPAYDAADGAETAGTSLFQPNVARLYLTGMVGDATIDAGLNLRSFVADPTFPGGAQKVMTVDKFVEHLTISKPMDNFTFTAGKMWMNVGGFERRAFYDGDTYLTSLANGGEGGRLLGATPGSESEGAVVTPENMSGVAAAYTITPDHKVEFQLANQTNSDSELLTSVNKRHTMGLAYWGSFADKMVQTYLSYTIGAADTVAAGHEQTFLGAGFRLAPMENLTVDLEYLANSDKENVTDTKSETTSTFVEARYKMGMWVPVLKYEMSTDKVADNDNFKRNAFAVALEIVPKAEDAFRYHVAYTSIKDDFEAPAAEDTTKNIITVGFKYVGDIVK